MALKETISGLRPSTGRHRRRLKERMVRPAGAVALLAGAAILGTYSSSSTTLVFVAVLLVAALPLTNGRPATWIGLAVILPWVSRLLTVWGPAPRFLDFMDFPLVIVAFLFAGLRYLDSQRRLNAAERKICRRLLFAAVVIALSWAFNDLHEPQRLIAAWVLALEPFLLLVAIVITPMNMRERRALLTVLSVVLCAQLLFSLAEILSGASGDAVKGTLLGAGAGHHVSAGGLSLGFCILAKQRVPKLLVAAFGALALFVIVVADAKQILFALPLALLVLGLTGTRRKSAASVVGGVVGGVAMAGASVYALLSYQASNIAFDFINRSTTNDTGKIAVVKALWGDVTGTFGGTLFGLGPGESTSRLAFLTTPAQAKTGSPAALLELHVSRGAQHYDAIAFSGPYTGKSSFTAATSSAMGILGDYGVFGVVVFGALILAVLGALLRAEDRRLRSSALAAWALLLPLAVVFDWLEQPPFTLAVFAMTGLAIRRASSLESGAAETSARKDQVGADVWGGNVRPRSAPTRVPRSSVSASLRDVRRATSWPRPSAASSPGGFNEPLVQPIRGQRLVDRWSGCSCQTLSGY